jgi:hypothetical protein
LYKFEIHVHCSIVTYARLALDGVLTKFQDDANVATVTFVREIVRLVVLPPFQAVLVPLSPQILKPMEEIVPETLKEFVDLQEVLFRCSKISIRH